MPNVLPETEVRGSLFGHFYYGSYNIYYTVWADYVNGSLSSIAFLNLESMRVPVVSLCITVAFWLEKDEFEYAYATKSQNISAVKAESEERRRAFRSCRLETKLLLALSHDADGHLAFYLAPLKSWRS